MENSFLPNTLAGWITLLVEIGTVIAVAVAVTWKLIIGQINGVGARVNEVELQVKGNIADITTLKRLTEQATHQSSSIAEKLGKVEGKIDKLDDAMMKERTRKSDGDIKVAERLAAIESKLDILDELKDVLRSLSQRN